MADERLNVEHLHRLARDRSRQGRSRLVAAIADLYAGTERVLTEADRQTMLAIILELLNGIEAAVRQALAERFADRADAPHALVRALAEDEIGVAFPLLARSEVLRDADLIEIVQQRTMEHQLAVAARRMVSEKVSEALAATGNTAVAVRLVENPGARIAPATMAGLVARARDAAALQAPLVGRADLPPALAKKLYWNVSVALRQHLVARHGLDPAALDDAIETAVHGLLDRPAPGAHPPDADAPGADAPESGLPDAGPPDSGALGPALLALLRRGAVEEFVARLAAASHLRPTLLRRLVFEPGGESFAVCCKALGVAKGDFLPLFLLCRQGRIGDQQVDDAEFTNIADFFDRIQPAAAQSMLQYWQRDPDYLAAQHRLGAGSGEAATGEAADADPARKR